MRPVLFLLLAGASSGCGADGARRAAPPADAPATAEAEAPARGGRLRPAPGLACDINQLTSWTGRVSGYRRDAAGLWFRIATDEETVEEATIAAQGDALLPQLRIDSAAFAPDDWARVEAKPGTLLEGMRATAWICLDGKTAPVLDFRPPAE